MKSPHSILARRLIEYHFYLYAIQFIYNDVIKSTCVRALIKFNTFFWPFPPKTGFSPPLSYAFIQFTLFSVLFPAKFAKSQVSVQEHELLPRLHNTKME